MILKCKMCGDDIVVNEQMTYGTCESCGTTSTLPKIDSDQLANLYNRANHLRRQNDFDGALKVYERIINMDNTQAEAHWCAVLCRYGIEYVVDPTSNQRVPTCHRASYDDILQDIDYLEAIKHTVDIYTRNLYETEVNYIAKIQKEIIAISQKEQAYDVFICYKETDDFGQRTSDSVIAQDIYYQLLNEGYKVFFSRITLEKQLGQAYEPYIFAALNSSKVMLVLGTDKNYMNAIWVKNEWSRYLNLMKKDSKKLLIPCYRDMDAYDIPDELSMLQSQDMSKIGFIQDLIRGIRKVLVKEETPVIKVVESGISANVNPLLNRVKLFLEDSEWQSAFNYCNKALDIDAECAMAYAYIVCAKLKCRTLAGIPNQDTRFLHDKDCQKAIRFGDSALKAKLEGYDKIIANRLEENRKASIYSKGIALQNEGKYNEAFEMYKSIANYKDAKIKIEQCEEGIKENIYQTALQMVNSKDYQKAGSMFSQIIPYKDSAKKLVDCTQANLSIIDKEIKIIKQTIEKLQSLISIAEARKAIQVQYAPPKQQIKETIDKLQSELMQKKIDHNKLGIALFGKNKKIKDQISIDINNIQNDIEKAIKEQEVCAMSMMTDIREKTRNITNPMHNFSISCGKWYTVALKADGTAIGTKPTKNFKNYYDQFNVEKWSEIVAISAGWFHTVGLKADGTVVVVGTSGVGACDIKHWRNIVAISVGPNHTVGLRTDGSVVVTKCTGDKKYNHGQFNVSSWKNIMAISAGSFHTVGLKADGTIVAVGTNERGRCNVAGWSEIVAISAGYSCTVGLKSDGTVVAVGDNFLLNSVASIFI
ncbi:MAG: TIR domain-containing protein, partial [Clostridia bacterium]